MSSQENGQPVDPGQLLTVTDRRVGGALVITATGEVDIATGPKLQAALTSGIHTADVARVVLDLSAVTFLGSRGLVALVDAAAEAGRLDKRFRIAVGNQHPVYRVLEVTGLDKELAVYKTLDEALNAE
jgi:anti-sigma B factor antagonist